MSYEIYFNLDQTKIFSSGNELSFFGFDDDGQYAYFIKTILEIL